MGGGEPEEDEESTSAVVGTSDTPFISGVKLVDAPIQFLVVSHKAFRNELAELRRLAVETAERAGISGGHELVVDLSRRFEFLKLVYKYHCAAEDEVIFMSLDSQVKNVIGAYSLEHTTIDDIFTSIFHFLELLEKEDEDTVKVFQELIFCIGTIETVICQHMLKEEKQVFPLLRQKFTLEEQATLVWQYMSSVPMNVLEEFLPWMTSTLLVEERLDVLHCMQIVVPKDTLLQEVFISWLDNKQQYALESCSGSRSQSAPDTLESCSSEVYFGEEHQRRKANTSSTRSRYNPFDGINVWHSLIRRDLNEIQEELCQMRVSNNFRNLSSVIIQLKFFADILFFYRNALDRVFYPMFNKISKNCNSPYIQIMDVRQVEGLQTLLYFKLQSETQLSNFVEMLSGELELFVRIISKNLYLLETEVFPSIRENCCHELQLWSVYTSLHMMPLGLLKCAISWFSAHLSKDELQRILDSITPKCSSGKKTFANLIYEWVRLGYSGKTSIENFRRDLHAMFNNRNYFFSNQIREDSSLSLQLDMKLLDTSQSLTQESHSAIRTTATAYPVSPLSSTFDKNDTSYFSGINLQIYFPQVLKKASPLSNHPAECTSSSTVTNLESRPMDHIFFIHRALRKDLEHLVFLASKLAVDGGRLVDFKRSFQLLQFLYQIHSNSEDEIAFPALESKRGLVNISHSYSIDHKLEAQQFNKISLILNEISEFHSHTDKLIQRTKSYYQLCVKLHDACISMHKVLSEHINREEVELWPLFTENFTVEEQEKIVGRMLGRTRAEMLQEMIPWLMASLTPDEQHAMISLWRKATRNTKFDEWLGEWWGDTIRFDIAKAEGLKFPSSILANPLEVVSKYLSNEDLKNQGKGDDGGVILSERDRADYVQIESPTITLDKTQVSTEAVHGCQSHDFKQKAGQDIKSRLDEVDRKSNQRKEVDRVPKDVEACQTVRHKEHPLIMNQEELEATIRRVSRDSTLDPKRKSYIIQNLLMSRWIVIQQQCNPEKTVADDKEEVPGQCPSYRDTSKLAFGCKHYKRNCKLFAGCCNKLYTCIRCHDDETDHPLDRKMITKMMCMKCLQIQPIGPKCSTPSCSNFSMAKYYCRICKLFDDDRQIYHCPYCNLCRVGKGLGIDYFHCMNCNACMSRSLSVHVCREKCFEDNCPICHEYIFTSSAPVKALPCGHLMHSACFQDYTCTHYTCPICGKSLGDMQVYFGMIDALLAEEKIPEEYSGLTQVILCNDCEKRGTASFHWLYHKCLNCGSYNTRLL